MFIREGLSLMLLFSENPKHYKSCKVAQAAIREVLTTETRFGFFVYTYSRYHQCIIHT
jgi:hypothetical protein